MGAKSGIQKEVLALYRTLLREASKKDRMTVAVAKPEAEAIPSFLSLLFPIDSSSSNNNNNSSSNNSGDDDVEDNTSIDNVHKKSSTAHVRYEFRKQASQVGRKDFRAIEYKIRHGYKQIKLLQMPGVVTFRSW